MKVLQTEIKLIETLQSMAHNLYFTKAELARSISRQLDVNIGLWVKMQAVIGPHRLFYKG